MPQRLVSNATVRAPRPSTLAKPTLLLLALLVSFGCGDGDELQRALSGEAATSGTILAALSGARTAGGTMGVVVAGAQPIGSDAAYTATLMPSSSAVTNGGTASIDVTSATAFSEVTVAVEGLAGHYHFALPGPTTSVTLQLTIDQDIAQGIVDFSVVLSDGANLGPAAMQEFVIVFVGTGDVQVSLTFDQQDDVDLHVTDPNGDTVYFANRSVPSGGMLDLDANPVCGAPFGNAENVTWPTGSAPDGLYTVEVDLFSSCFPSDVNYTVTITVVGQNPILVSGTLTPADELAGPMVVANFMVGP